MESFLTESDEYISGSTKSNLVSVVVSACVILVIAVDETFVVEVVVDIVVVEVVVDVVVKVVMDELDSGTDRTSAAAGTVVVGMIVVVGSSSEQTVFPAAFHLHASSSNHEKKSLKYYLKILQFLWRLRNSVLRIYLYLLQSQTYLVVPQSSIHSIFGSVSSPFSSQINRGPKIFGSQAS